MTSSAQRQEERIRLENLANLEKQEVQEIEEVQQAIYTQEDVLGRNKIEEVASIVSYNIKHPGHEQEKKQEVLLDPASIALIIKAIVGVVQLIKRCRDSSDTGELGPDTTEGIIEVAYKDKANEFDNMNRRSKRRLKTAIKRKIGWWNYWRKGKEITEGIVNTGKYMSTQEVDELIEEV